jgi:class 3 adenylate cyclase/tetratricopeptide (TPR) repeat protein
MLDKPPASDEDADVTTGDELLTDEVQALDRAIAALEQQRDVLGDAVVDTALRPLEDKRGRLMARHADRRKMVTALFSDLVDSTPMTARLGAETMREVMSRYFGLWRSAIEAEGGMVEKFIGDAVVGIFGMVRSREDDAHRAVRAALRVQEPLALLSEELQAEHGVPLTMRVGIDTGEVVLGAVGERGDDDIVVVGESLNRAARLQAVAPPGGVLVSHDTARHVRGAFALQRLDAMSLKGFGEPVHAFLVQSEREHSFWVGSRGIEGVTTRTVGRDVELGQLRRVFADVAAERTEVVVTVLGEAGIGKSRLLSDFETWLASLPESVWVLRGRADPAAERVPHALLRSAFAERLGILDSDGPETVRAKWRGGVGSMVSGGGRRAPHPDDVEAIATWLGFALGEVPALAGWRQDPERLQRRARQALAQLLAAMAAQGPVVLLLEDLHWADGATLDWIQTWEAVTSGVPLLVVATSRPSLLERRPHWGEGLHGHRIVRLHPLSRRESRELVGEVLQRVPELPDEVWSLVVEAGEGNPFFIEELVAWLIDRGVVVTGPGGWSVVEGALSSTAVPGTLRGVLQARLDSLEPDERDVADRASVIGRVFWDSAVECLAGSAGPAGGDAFQRLRAREVVHQRPTSAFEHAREYSFRHALLRDVAYDGLLRPRRRHYHALAARWMQEAVESSGRGDEHAALVADHLLAAGQGRQAATWFLRAGRHAADSFAGEQALELLAQAETSGAPEDSDLRFEIWVEQEKVLDRLGRRDVQRRVLDAMADRAGEDPARRAVALLAHGRWLFFHADYTSAAPVAREAAQLAREAGRDDLEVEALILGGRSRAFRGDHGAAREDLEAVLARARQVGSDRQVAETQRLLGVVATNLHEEGLAVEVLTASIEGFRAASDLEGEGLALGQLGAVHLLTGDLESARERSEEALAIFVASRHLLRQGTILGNLMSIAIEQGRLDEAMRLGRETLALTEAVEDPEGIVSTLQRLGETARFLGDLVSARGWLERAAAEGAAHELDYFTAFTWFTLTVLEITEGHPEAARTAAEVGSEAACRSEVPATLARASHVRGLAHRAAGDPETAVKALHEAERRHTELGMGPEARECRASRAGALLDAGHVAEAVDAARGLISTLDRPEPTGGLEPGLALWECHRVLTAGGDADARLFARAARRFLDERGALVADTALRRRFLATEVNRRLASIAADAWKVR